MTSKIGHVVLRIKQSAGYISVWCTLRLYIMMA